MKKILAALILTTGLFFSCTNGSNTASNNSEEAGTPPDGKAIYVKVCQQCHQANGEGVAGTFPPLAKSDFLANKQETILQVLNGKTGELTVNGQKYNSIMPGQAMALNDAEIAAVTSYVYSSFGNDGTKVTGEEVKSLREKSK